AEVSADGWNWSTSGMANEYTIRNTPYNYSERGRRYDYEGQTNGVPVDLNDLPDVARAACGYIWDSCLAHNVSFRNYGLFTEILSDDVVPGMHNPDGAPISRQNMPTKKALFDRTDVNYLEFAMAYADSDAW